MNRFDDRYLTDDIRTELADIDPSERLSASALRKRLQARGWSSNVLGLDTRALVGTCQRLGFTVDAERAGAGWRCYILEETTS